LIIVRIDRTSFPLHFSDYKRRYAGPKKDHNEEDEGNREKESCVPPIRANTSEHPVELGSEKKVKKNQYKNDRI
jgi:hypothetical protein